MSTFACAAAGGRQEIVVAEYDRSLFGTSASAWISEDRAYRYLLTRDWDDGPVMTWIMLNPSSADAFADDPTIRRCTGFARREGCAGIRVVNLFAVRSPDPHLIGQTADPIGPCNDRFIDENTRDGPVVAAWGSYGSRAGRGLKVGTRLEAAGVRLMCLGRLGSGQPRHPLYARADAPLVRYEPLTTAFPGIAARS
jgi:hypothetical protein